MGVKLDRDDQPNRAYNYNRNIDKALIALNGICTGITADGDATKLPVEPGTEIYFLEKLCCFTGRFIFGSCVKYQQVIKDRDGDSIPRAGAVYTN